MIRVRDPTSTSLIAFLDSLYVPKSKSEKFAKLMEMAKCGDIREWTQEDRGILIHALEISYNDAFSFRLKKCGKGKWNKRDAIDEREISAEEFEEAFGVVEGNIVAPTPMNPYETHKPDKLEPVNAEAL